MRAALALVALLLAGCAKDRCAAEPASFQLDVVDRDSGASSQIATLIVSLVSGDRGWRQSFDVRGMLDDGQTSLAVLLDPPPTGALDLEITVEARSAAGPLLGEASGKFSATADGCNHFSLELGGGGQPGDGGVGDAVIADATPGSDTLDPDAGPATDAFDPDAEAIDLAPPDGGVVCEVSVDPGTVALYEMNDSMSRVLTDSVGAHPGTLVNNLSVVAGAPSCDNGIRFSGSANVQGWLLIPDSPAWQLAEGSVEIAVDSLSVPRLRQGVISRAQAGIGVGDLDVWLTCDRTIVAAIGTAGGQTYYQCSNQTVGLGFAQILVQFGPQGFELWVNGERGTRTDTIGLGGNDCQTEIVCGTSTTAGLLGGDAPWVIGADNTESDNGTNRLAAPLRSGVVDNFRISSVRRR